MARGDPRCAPIPNSIFSNASGFTHDYYAGTAAILAGPDCDVSFAERAERVAAKARVYTTTPGYVGALAWAWQPGRDDGDCDLGNLDVDAATQEVLRTQGG